ncbi:MAG: DNA polymerase III subunit delta' [Sulfuricella sp.]|nr:DNA polymerase III subunit delta' [Sulfuricella sp.]
MNNNVYPWQRDLLRQLVSARAQLPNALLLQGKDGIGKHRFASVLSQALLCDAPAASGEPCGQCTSCGWFKAGGHPDFRLLAPEAQDEPTEPAAEQGKTSDKKASKYITVAQVRELADFINLTTHRHGMRIILIHPAEAMNAQAANALLKTLEEPPAGTLFILVSHQPQRLLPTVRSRCRKVNAPLPDRKEAMLWLHEQGLTDTASFLAQSGYAPLAALQLSDADHQAKRSQVFGQLAVPRTMDPLVLAEQGEKLGLAWMLQWLQQWVYDLASLGLTGQARYQAEPSPETVRLAKTVNLIELFKFQQELSAAQRTLQHPLNPRLVLEQLLLSYWQTANRQESAHV